MRRFQAAPSERHLAWGLFLAVDEQPDLAEDEGDAPSRRRRSEEGDRAQSYERRGGIAGRREGPAHPRHVDIVRVVRACLGAFFHRVEAAYLPRLAGHSARLA